MEKYTIVDKKNKRLIVEFCPDDGSQLSWIVWDKQTNTSPSGWLESKSEAKKFLNNLYKDINHPTRG